MSRSDESELYQPVLAAIEADADTLYQWLDDHDAVLVDGRETPEWTCLHPGEVLVRAFLEPAGPSRRRLARETGVSPQRAGDPARRNSTVSLDMAPRLAHYFCTADDFRLRARMEYDPARTRDQLGKRIGRGIKPRCPPNTKGAAIITDARRLAASAGAAYYSLTK